MNQVVSERQQQILAIRHEWRETNEAEQAGLAVLEALSDIITGLDATDAISTWDLIADNSLILDFLNMINWMPLKHRCCILNRPSTLLPVSCATWIRLRNRPRDHLLHQRALDIFFGNLFSDWGTKAFIIEKNIENLKKLQDSTEDVMESLAAKKRRLETTLEVLAIEDTAV